MKPRKFLPVFGALIVCAFFLGRGIFHSATAPAPNARADFSSTAPRSEATRVAHSEKANSARASTGANTRGALPASPQKSSASGSGSPALFYYIERPSQADRWEKLLDAPTQKIAYVQINSEAALGKKSAFWRTGGGGTLQIALPNGQAVDVVIDETKQGSGVDQFVASGRVANDPTSRVLFAYRDGEMSALIEGVSTGPWQLRAMADGIAQLYQVDVMQVPPCGVTPATSAPDKMALLARRSAAAASSAASSAGTTTTTTTVNAVTSSATEFRILILYTDAVAAASSASAIGTQADLAIATLNNDLARSQVVATATLAGTAQVSYDESKSAGDKVQDDALTRLADESDGYMDNIHDLRDQLGADLVCLALNRRDSASAGLAYILTSPHNRYNDTSGFSVVQYSVMNSQSVFSHEIGHNFGCAHDRENSKDDKGNLTQGAYPYSYGYRFTGADNVQYRTIMAYSPGQHLSYYSNPNIIAPAPISHAVGSAEGNPDQADNARTIRQDLAEVSAYRANTPLANGNSGILLNVSTRAFVGAGERQLIGGFIISGNSPKRMLVRAIGPTLNQFGVTDALSDPQVRLVRLNDGVQLDANDNWQTGPNAAAVASAMTEAKAFSLPNGSRDAAIVATLAPGGYTANVEGVNGATGTALVEAYELDTTGSRLANLSTRAYADSAKPLIGGFIIQADPGLPNKTKRVVICVLGPSLANYNISGAMDDPMFELHDANGATILTNDDWSTADSVSGDDTKPAAVTTAQKNLAATGLAPGNRRDSGVLIDLAPGAYTAVVKPFSDPPTQPEKPGVAIVEVFEILP
ncbi:MAG TPA: M12 family metallo-peptidase [Opitutaceae bacterium]|nr:M12 family metallo-peptidase [Opitutaceae bacterium]